MSGNLKDLAILEIEKASDKLLCVNEEIWKNPELNFNEHKAHLVLTNFLEDQGFNVERSYLGMQTAFRATIGEDDAKPHVCVICEYDALPEIGHACGHNLIAEAGAAAGLGLKAALLAHGAPKGKLTVMGTPAEEGGGGKIDLIKAGAFDTVDVAMMVHPSPVNVMQGQYLALMDLEVTFHGKAAHAAAFPWEGRNALDAAVLAYNSISALRQQLKPDWRLHGIISNGGAKPNIIPELSAMEYYLRAPTKDEVDELHTKVMACFEAAAQATGCSIEVKYPTPLYTHVEHNPTLCALFEANCKTFGVSFQKSTRPMGSTDMGNVSLVVPSIHPLYAIGDGSQVNHTKEFTAEAKTLDAHQKTLTFAKAMAMTGIDVLTTPELLEKVKSTFQHN